MFLTSTFTFTGMSSSWLAFSEVKTYEISYPKEAGGGGQDMWAELQEAADPVKVLPFTFLGAREKSALCTGSFSPRRV